MKTYLRKGLVLLAGVVGSTAALAEPGTYDAITGAIDWADVVTAIAAVAALIAAVLVVKRGSHFLLGMIGR